MDYNKLISDMVKGDEIEGFYILKDAFPKVTAAGKPFLNGIISDRSGSIDIKVWDYSGPVGNNQSDVGQVVKLRGQVSDFKGTPQIVLSNIRLAVEDDKFDAANLVPVAPIDREDAEREIQEIISSIQDEDYRRVAQTLFQRHRESFLRIPAAKSVHHSFLSGLLMHTLNMLRTADFLSGLYAEIIDRSLLLTGTLLHDFAKESEFAFSKLGMVTDYSTKGQLLGHLVMGAQEAAETAAELGVPDDKSVLLQHMILSHHGEPEFGAAVVPMCAEAELLSYIDRMDSRMEIYAEALPDVPEGGFSSRIFALEKKIYNHGTLQ